VVKDVILRDTQTRAARQVHVHLDSMAEYGFMLNYPCRSFASLPACGEGSTTMAIRPWWRPKAAAGMSAKGRGRPVGLRVGPLLLAVVIFRRRARHALPPRPGEMGARSLETFGIHRMRSDGGCPVWRYAESSNGRAARASWRRGGRPGFGEESPDGGIAPGGS